MPGLKLTTPSSGYFTTGFTKSTCRYKILITFVHAII